MTNTTHEMLPEWTAPTIYKVDNSNELSDLMHAEKIRFKSDPIDALAEEMFELEHPDLLRDDAAKSAYIDDIVARGDSYGRWVYYDYLSAIVHIVDKDNHYDLRTNRNRNLITRDEQRNQLRPRTIAAFGLSVGSNVVDSSVQAGIGDSYLLFDYDRLSTANLNRIQAGLGQVGLYKTTVEGRKIAELDPYISQQHFTGGYDRDTDDILRRWRPDVIVEEVDDLEVKVRLRRIAGEIGAILVMAGDADDKATLDIERYDLGEAVPFNGKLTEDDMDLILSGAYTPQEKLTLLVKILGSENISQSLWESAQQIGSTVAGIPQKGTTARLGASGVTVMMRDALLGKKLQSQSQVIDVPGILHY
jgi:hypothetical protein